MLTGELDFVLKNMITKSLLHWIDKLRETDLDALHSKNQVSAENETDSQALESKSEISTKPEYRILCLSYNEKDRKKMAGLFAQFPELKVDAQISSALPARLSGYHLLLFDNYSLGKIDHIDDAPDDEARGHLQLMVKWLYDKKKNEDREIRPGFLIHYGKSSEIVNEYSDYCAAANFPFTLYGLIRQIIDFWQDSQTSFLNQEALIEGE